jgi:hypothetical protein
MTEDKPLFWNREIRENHSQAPIVRTAKIISLSSANLPAWAPLHTGDLPEGAELLQIGSCIADFDIPELLKSGVNTIFVAHFGARELLAQLLQQLPSIQWIHTVSAGIDFVSSDTLSTWAAGGAIMTNAKGQSSSSLAEYALGACLYFCKDFGRLKRNQRDKNWDRYVGRAYVPIEESSFPLLTICAGMSLGRLPPPLPFRAF